MTKSTVKKLILNAALGEYQAKGFRLVEPDDHTLILFHQDEQVAVFSLGGALIPSIHQACEEYFEKAGA